MSTPFDTNPAFRKVTYRLQWIANGVLAVLGAFFAATVNGIDALPSWYVVALAVLPVLWTYLGVQADTNTSAAVPRRNDRGEALLRAVGYGLIVLAVLLALAVLFKFVVVSWVAIIVSAVLGVVLVALDGGVGRRVV